MGYNRPKWLYYRIAQVASKPVSALVFKRKMLRNEIEDKQGTLSLSPEGFRLTGTLRGEEVDLRIPLGNTPTLPFGPGNYLEIQQGESIYRCVPEDGRIVMKFINTVKAFYELKQAPEGEKICAK